MRMNAIAMGLCAALGVAGCGDGGGGTSVGGPAVEVAVGALTTADITGATYRFTIEFSEDAGATWQALYGPAVMETDPGDGAAGTFIGPCQAAPDGGVYPNRVTLEMESYRAGEPPDEETVTTGLPPAQKIVFDCEENTDHRVAFEFQVITSAEQGFTDITVDLGTNHCAMKVDCQEALETDGAGNRGFTMVTGFACSSGEPDAFLAFYGEVCCSDPNAAGGPAEYCTPIDDNTSDVSGNPGLLKMGSYAGDELVLDKQFRNTTWRFDEAWLTADGARACTLTADGWITPEASGPGEDTYPGPGYPKVTWTATVDATTIGPTHVTDCGDVQVGYGTDGCNRAGSPFGGGAGTVADPFQLCSPDHVQNMEGHLTEHFVVVEDIDFAGWTGGDNGDFISIGTPGWTSGGFDPSVLFSGTLRGDGHTLANFTNVNSDVIAQGKLTVSALFGGMWGGTISDLRFDSPVVLGSGGSNGDFVSVVVGLDYGGTIEGVHIAGAQVSGLPGAILPASCGGVVGLALGLNMSAIVRDSTVDLVTADCTSAGGVGAVIAGNATDQLLLQNVGVTGSITADTTCGGMAAVTDINGEVHLEGVDNAASVACGQSAGGLIGEVGMDVYVTGSRSTGDVSAPGQTAGGLLGATSSAGITSFVTQSWSAGAVSGGVVGGLIGDSSAADISESFTLASLTGATVGGIIGNAGGATTLTHVWSAPKLSVCTTCEATIGTTASIVTGTEAYRFDDALTGAVGDSTGALAEVLSGSEATTGSFSGFAFGTVWEMATLALNPHAPANPTMPALK